MSGWLWMVVFNWSLQMDADDEDCAIASFDPSPLKGSALFEFTLCVKFAERDTDGGDCGVSLDIRDMGK